MTRALFLLALLPALALAQGRPPSSASSSSGTACALASASAAFAASYRATTATNLVPGYACDGILEKCVKFGPGVDAHCGTNVAGEVLCGRSGGTGVWRFYGTAHFNTANAQNISVSNVGTIAILLQTTSGYAENQSGTLPWRVKDIHGFKNECTTALPTCGTQVGESTEVAICGTGGAVTKRCYCTSDGTNFAWRNTLNPGAGAGTSSTCPAT